jgi:hypothetical protein
MPSEDAVLLLHDSDWLVRYTAALKVDPDQLSSLLDDPEPDVRELARQRFNLTASTDLEHD